MVWYCHCFKNFPQFVVIHIVKDFGVISKPNVFLELSCFFNDPMDVGNLISGSSAFSKTSLNIREFTVHIFLKSGLENFKYIMRNAGLDEAQAGIKIARRNMYNLRYADETTLMAEGKEELKSLLVKVKEEMVKKLALNSTFRKLRS